jgi:hypothetical protein
VVEETAPVSVPRALPRLRIGAVVAVALAAGFVTWLVLRPGGDKAGSPAAPAGARAVPHFVPAARLRAVAATLGHPLYWAGERRGTRLELTEAGGGRTFIRYLPRRVKAGDPRARFLAVGTYARPNAFAETRTAGRKPGVVTVTLGGGGIAVYDPVRPTSVYFASRGSPVQVEVFDPNARVARSLVLERQVVPIR